MGLTLLTARKRPNGSFYVKVLLDDTNPDGPTMALNWPRTPSGMTQAAYVAQIKAETKLLAQLAAADLAPPDAGVVMPGEGSAL